MGAPAGVDALSTFPVPLLSSAFPPTPPFPPFLLQTNYPRRWKKNIPSNNLSIDRLETLPPSSPVDRGESRGSWLPFAQAWVSPPVLLENVFHFSAWWDRARSFLRTLPYPLPKESRATNAHARTTKEQRACAYDEGTSRIRTRGGYSGRIIRGTSERYTPMAGRAA